MRDGIIAPEKSLYQPLKQFMQDFKVQGNRNGMSGDAYAKSVVRQVLRKSVKEEIWEGKLASLLKFMTWAFPRWLKVGSSSRVAQRMFADAAASRTSYTFACSSYTSWSTTTGRTHTRSRALDSARSLWFKPGFPGMKASTYSCSYRPVHSITLMFLHRPHRDHVHLCNAHRTRRHNLKRPHRRDKLVVVADRTARQIVVRLPLPVRPLGRLHVREAVADLDVRAGALLRGQQVRSDAPCGRRVTLV